MRPIIRWTIWQRRWSIFWWCIGLAAFVALELSVYPSIKSQAKQLNEALSHLSPAVKSLFGVSSDLFSPTGYLNSRLYYLLLPLMLSVLTIGWGSSILSREESSGTIEMLLARPISRRRLLMAKIFSGLIITIIISAITTLLISILIKAVGIDVSVGSAVFAAFLATLLAILFGCLAFCLAAFGRIGRGLAIAVSSLIGLGGYIVSSLEANISWLSWPAKIFPFHYYNPLATLNGYYAWRVAGCYALASAVLILVSYFAFRNRDLS